MKIHEKISKLKTVIKEIKNISEKLDNYNDLKSKIKESNNEILRLKKGINESINELEEFLGEEDA
tara:strand:- start:284 stop:478 length:195 start_codon:yes stop_codon:yes gene_type:complete